ncbi:hypothetical protein K505DRAFT_382100 [Melanomma pulvis-pyrius CBS 109.77]|uniref:Uncharacterized protein n=1 Tax=Melanomma pulvis-pyrius CBS 109.77 TaxID=1314802 RepID=A0A6A6WN75_9PLEO|nr:hypothetical protein K505DRAFT_382100 [Melanomma pulvis-pyrius CBS 109.77]
MTYQFPYFHADTASHPTYITPYPDLQGGQPQLSPNISSNIRNPFTCSPVPVCHPAPAPSQPCASSTMSTPNMQNPFTPNPSPPDTISTTENTPAKKKQKRNQCKTNDPPKRFIMPGPRDHLNDIKLFRT